MSLEDRTEKSKELLIALLESGNTVDIKASGLSMFPLLHPDDILRVRPVKVSQLNRGDVIVYKNEKKIISHRYIKTEEGKIICKGDGLKFYDSTVHPGNLLGVVIARTRRNKTADLTSTFYRKLGLMLSFFTPVTGYFFYYFSYLWYKLFFDKK